VLAAAAVFLGLVLIAQLQPGQGQGPGPGATSSAGEPTATELPVVRRDAGDPMALGSVDAPVVLVEWTDFRCPYCAVFSRETLPVVIKEYVETGKVRLEVNDVAFFGDQSVDAAVAARAAGEQGKFHEFMTTVYEAAPEKKHADLTRERLIALAKKAGVPDVARFSADLDRKDLRNAVQSSTTAAQQLGVTSVPFFVAGETALPGAQPSEVFRQFLDDAVAKAGS
jgi:protein-disulfide isomerase